MRRALTQAEAPGERLRPRRPAVAGLVALTVVALASQRAAATTGSFWERVAASPRVEADHLLGEAEALLTGPDGAPRAEPLVRRALALVPDDFRGLAAMAAHEALPVARAQAVVAVERHDAAVDVGRVDGRRGRG